MVFEFALLEPRSGKGIAATRPAMILYPRHSPLYRVQEKI